MEILRIVRIGKYTIAPYNEGTVLISHDNGESEEIQEAELEKVIDKFFKKNL